METAIVQENSPHLRRKDNLKGMMLDVIIALSPVLVFALVKYTWHAVLNIVLSVLVMCLAEFVFVLIKNWGPKDGQKHPFKEKFLTAVKGYGINNFLVPCVSALIFAMLMPAQETNPAGFIYFVVVIGALFGMIFGKLVFGGTGTNIFNPAAVGFIFTKICFSSKFTTYYANSLESTTVTTGGTLLSSASANATSLSPLELLLGETPGAMGEVCKIAILVGLAYLLIRHVADWRVVSSFFGTFLVLTLIASAVYAVRDSSVNFGTYFLTSRALGWRPLRRHLYDHRSGHDADHPPQPHHLRHGRGGQRRLYPSLRFLFGRHGLLDFDREHVRSGDGPL
jgi:electron transport complex protein RnfD